MITRSRRAALNSPSSSSPSSSRSTKSTATILTATSYQPNNNTLSVNNSCTNSGLTARLTRRRSGAITIENGVTGKVQERAGETIEDIVKDVVDDIVDYVMTPNSIPTASGSKQGEMIDTPGPDQGKGLPTLPYTSNFNYNTTTTTTTSSQFQPSSFFNNTAHHENNNESPLREIENNVNQIESITCEVSFEADMSDDDFGRCPVCQLFGRLDFEGHLGDRLGKVCSKRCLDKLKLNSKACICVACGKGIAPDCQGYLANFGQEKSTLCSEECLLKFEKENEPVQKCYSCKKEITGKDESNSTIFYWQTMEFCSPECIENLQQFWGKKCANCSATVPKQSLGKYSVRFGNVIKQFCYGACLEQYKKVIKVCAYCQINLSGCVSTCTSVAGGSNTKRIREFCDPICRSHYLQMVSLRNSTTNDGKEGAFSSPACACCQCSRIVEKSSCLDLIFRGRKFMICSSFCLSAFKFSFDVAKIICESCSKYGWSYRSANILHYSGFTKLFCSRKCLQMHVLKIRRIQSCLTCNVKKYNFDLVEKFDLASGDSNLFCSTYCYSAFEQFESQNKGKDPKAFCDWCRKLSRLPFHIPSPDKTVKNFCTYACVIAHQRKESNSGQYGFDNMTFPRPNQPLNRPNTDSTFKQLGPTLPRPFSPSVNTENLPKSVPLHEPSRLSSVYSSLTSKQPSTPSPIPTSISTPIANSSSSSISTPLSTTIQDFQRSYATRSRSVSKYSLNESSLTNSQVSPSRLPTQHDYLNSNSTVTYPYYNNNNTCNKVTDRLDSLPEKETSSNASGPSHCLDDGNESNRNGNYADKSTMWQPSRRTKATLCRPSRKDRSTQTERSINRSTISDCSNNNNNFKGINSEINETGTSQEKILADQGGSSTTAGECRIKCIPVPVFIPIFVPIPIPVPVGSTSLLPLPLPTPIPFGFPVDSRLTPSHANEETDKLHHPPDGSPKADEEDDQQTPNVNSKDSRNKEPKSASDDTLDNDSDATIISNSDESLDSEFKSNEQMDVKSVKLKRNAQDYSERSNFKQQGSPNSNKNDTSFCEDNDNCSNGSCEDNEKTKRRRLTIPTHG